MSILAIDKNLTELQAQAEFQRKTLEQRRKDLINEPFVVEYDNGGGQVGTKENPEWTAYEKLLKSYHATLRAIALQTGGKKAEKQTGIGSPLKNFRSQYENVKVVKSA